MRAYGRELQASLRNNSSAYGFSIMITASFGMLVQALGEPSVTDVFLFAAGGVAAFSVLEAAATAGFRHRTHAERPDVVALGSAFSFLSVGAGVGIAALAGHLLTTGVAWPLGSFAASCTYLLIVAAEMLLARRLQERSEAHG